MEFQFRKTNRMCECITAPDVWYEWNVPVFRPGTPAFPHLCYDKNPTHTRTKRMENNQMGKRTARWDKKSILNTCTLHAIIRHHHHRYTTLIVQCKRLYEYGNIKTFQFGMHIQKSSLRSRVEVWFMGLCFEMQQICFDSKRKRAIKCERNRKRKRYSGKKCFEKQLRSDLVCYGSNSINCFLILSNAYDFDIHVTTKSKLMISF